MFTRTHPQLKHMESEIKGLPSRDTVAWVSIDTKPTKQALFTLLSKWTFAYTNHLLHQVLQETRDLQTMLTQSSACLRAFTEDPKSVPVSDVMAVITHVRQTSAHIEEKFAPWRDIIALLKRYGVDVPARTVEQVYNAPTAWSLLKKHMYQCRAMLEDTCTREQARLRKESSDIHALADAHCAWFKANMPFSANLYKRAASAAQTADKGAAAAKHTIAAVAVGLHAYPDPDAAYALIDSQRFPPIVVGGDESDRCLVTINARLREIQQQEELFDMHKTVHEGLEHCSVQLVRLKHMWDLVSLVITSFGKWAELPWQVCGVCVCALVGE